MNGVFKNSFRKQTRTEALLIVSLAAGTESDEQSDAPSCAQSGAQSGANVVELSRYAASASNGGKSKKRKRQPPQEGDAGLTLVECVDKAELLFVRDNIKLLKPSERTKFLNYAETMLSGGDDNDGLCAQTVHYYKKAHGFGRLYPHTVGLQGMQRSIRSTLAGKLYIDIDTSNAHPVVLVAIARENGWSVPCLEHYISAREAVLARTGLPRWIAKQLFLQQMYGGSVYNFIVEMIENGHLEKPVSRWMRRMPGFVFGYGQEIRQIAAKVHGIDPKVYQVAVASNESNPEASALAFLVQTRETKAVLCAIEAIRSRGWEVGALVHDGFMVYRRDAENLTVSAALLNLLRMRVKQQCGLDVHFELKDFEPTLHERSLPSCKE